MNKKAIILVVVAVVAISGGIYALTRNDTSPSSTSSSTQSSSSNSTSSNASQATAANAVSIQNFAFSPSDITIKKGTMVTWTNNDSTTHTVTKDNADTGPDSSDLTPGSVYRFTYNQVGTFKYHCKVHPDMTGTVTVTE